MANTVKVTDRNGRTHNVTQDALDRGYDVNEHLGAPERDRDRDRPTTPTLSQILTNPELNQTNKIQPLDSTPTGTTGLSNNIIFTEPVQPTPIASKYENVLYPGKQYFTINNQTGTGTYLTEDQFKQSYYYDPITKKYVDKTDTGKSTSYLATPDEETDYQRRSSDPNFYKVDPKTKNTYVTNPPTQRSMSSTGNADNSINQMYQQQKQSLVAQLKQKIAEAQAPYQDIINKAPQQFQPLRDQAAIGNARAGQTLREQLANTGNSASGMGRSELLQSALSGENQINSLNQQQQNVVSDAQTAINRLGAQGALEESRMGADMSAQELQALINDQYKQQDYGLNLAQLLGTYGDKRTLAGQQFDASKSSDAFNQQLSLAQLLGRFGNEQTLAGKQADRDYNLNLSDRTGTINGQQTLQAQNQYFQQAFNTKQQQLDEAYRQDQLSQQQYEFETQKLAQQKQLAMQEAGLTGYYNGSQTLGAQDFLFNRNQTENQYNLDLVKFLTDQYNYDRDYQAKLQQQEQSLADAKAQAQAKGQQQQYDNALKLWEQLGTVTADLSPILGLPKGTKTRSLLQTEYTTNKPYYNPNSGKKSGSSSGGYSLKW